eukprot:scaffold19316_cov48-Prasinocladus_malaysianus.AAC.1
MQHNIKESCTGTPSAGTGTRNADCREAPGRLRTRTTSGYEYEYRYLPLSVLVPGTRRCQ